MYISTFFLALEPRLHDSQGECMHGKPIVGLMEWAERLKHVPLTDTALHAIGLPKTIANKMAHNLYVFIKNYTEGHAREVVQYGAENGFDGRHEAHRATGSTQKPCLFGVPS